MNRRPFISRTLAFPRSGGFTLIEVLVALVVFAIAVIGLVALMGRSIESQRAAYELAQAEHLAQALMADLEARGFSELVEDGLPDDDLTPQQRLHALGRPPADIPDDQLVIGAVPDSYLAFRSIEPVFDLSDPDQAHVDALTLEVIVLWIDDSNPLFPPPAGLQVTDLVPSMADPEDPAFRPWVGYVRLFDVRVNDSVRQEQVL